MLTQFKNLSSWREDNITIKARETYTLDFLDTNPNMFVVINPNLAILKVSIGSLPLANHYEFKVDYNTTETLGRPTGTTKLYILNDSDLTINVKVFSIHDDFNLQILKNMNVNLEDYTIETSTEVAGVKDGVELPVKIDGVQHLELKNLLTSIANKSNTVTKNNITYLNKVTSFSYKATKNTIINFEWLFNDGEEATLYKTSSSGTKTALFTMSSGEAFADLQIEVNKNDTVTIESNNGACSLRVKYWTH